MNTQVTFTCRRCYPAIRVHCRPDFAQLEEFGRLPDESTILRIRHRLGKQKLAEQILLTVNELLTQHGLLLKVGTAVDATLIPSPCSNLKSNGQLLHF